MELSLPQIIFLYFAIVIVTTTLLTVTRKNYIHSIMWMLLLFLHIGGLYLFLNAEFLGAIQVIVYAGAILVIFVFVIMLLNLKDIEMEAFIKGWQSRLILILILALSVIIGIKYLKLPGLGKYSITYIETHTHTATLGKVLFNEYYYPFIIVGLILFVPMIAVIVLALKRSDG